MDCLTNVVGVTLSDCDCIINGLTAEQLIEIRTSTSGLYLDELPGGVHMKAIKTADACKSFYKMSTDALKVANKTLEADLIVALNSKYQTARKKFIGDIGRMSYAQTLNTTKRYQGIRIEPFDYSSSVMLLHKLNFIGNATVDFNVTLLRVPVDSVMGDILYSWPISATANTWATTTFNTPIVLPLTYNNERVEYWFVYDLEEPGIPFEPKDNKIECSNCDKLKGRISDFVNAYGVQFDSLTALNNNSLDAYAHGLSLRLTIQCDNQTLFCDQYDEDDAVAVVMANAAQFKGGELLIEEVLKSPDITRYTTMGREYLWGKRNHFRAEYEWRIKHLVQVINVEDSNCYVCRESANKPMKKTIFK